MDTASDKPKSAQVLNNRFLQIAARHPYLSTKLFRKSFLTAVVAQMLPDDVVLKGGASLALRYPLQEARSSRDVDTLYTGSKEQFLHEFQRKLQEGWEGFTGNIVPQERKRLPKGVDLTTLTVTLDYKGKRFASIDFEATPNREQHSVDAVREMDEQNAELFRQVGFDFTPPKMASPESQLADKLNALSDPDKRRGKDLRDIQIILRHHSPDLTELRKAVRATERVPDGHEVHVMAANMEEYRSEYEEALGDDLKQAWELANDLLEQVDCDAAYYWKDNWEDDSPSDNPQQLMEEAEREAAATREYLEANSSSVSLEMPPVLPSSGPIQVKSYRRSDGTIVHGYMRRR